MGKVNKVLVGVLLGLFTLVWGVGEAKANPDETLLGDKLSLSVGYKVWYARWSTWIALNGITQSTTQVTSQYQLYTGPQATLVYQTNPQGDWFKNVFLTAQYLSGNFSFPGNIFGVDGVNKSDVVVFGGVSVWKSLALFGGYYQQNQYYARASTFRFTGPLVGLSAAVAFPSSRLSVFGNTALGVLTFSDSLGLVTPTKNTYAYSAELGLQYSFQSLFGIAAPYAQVSMRGQVLEEYFNVGGRTVLAYDATYGPAFLVGARF